MLTYTLYKISFVNLDLGYGAAMSFFLLAVILGSTGILYFLWGRKEERRGAAAHRSPGWRWP